MVRISPPVARAEILPLARITTGSLLIATAADMAMSGIVTGRGPSDRRERQAMERGGWQPYSIKVGDRYFAYNRLDPIGMSLAVCRHGGNLGQYG